MQQNIDQSVMYPQPHLVRTALPVGLRVGRNVGLRVRRGARCGAVRRSGAALLGSTTAATGGRASRPPEAACAWRSGLSRVPRPGPQEAWAQLASRRTSLDTLQHPTSSGGDHMYAFISSLGSDGSSAAGAAPAAAGAADAAGADSFFCSLTMRDGFGARTDLRPTRRGAGGASSARLRVCKRSPLLPGTLILRNWPGFR